MSIPTFRDIAEIVRRGIAFDRAIASIAPVLNDLAAQADLDFDWAAWHQALRVSSGTVLAPHELYNSIRAERTAGRGYSDEQIADAIGRMSAAGLNPSRWQEAVR